MKNLSKGKKILLTILLVLAALVIGLLIFHRCKLAADMKFLKEQGYYDPVSTGERSVNVVRLGDEAAGHRIVVMSGMGGGFPAQMRTMTAELEKEYQLIFVARAGWDCSDDVQDERTVDTIVEDYRNTLQCAGIQAPYILMAHSMGGTYATYWVSKYPEEIEAFVNIDGTYVRPIEDLPTPSQQNTFFLQAALNLGIGDILTALSPQEPSMTAAQQRASNIMMMQSYASHAANNEAAYIDTNLNATWNALTANDVPKLYISARDGFMTKEEILNGPGLSPYDLEYYTPEYSGSDADREAEACEKWLAECEENRTQQLLPYAEKMGNCRIEYLPGDHFIYQTEPQKCGQIIQAFLEKAEG